MRFIYSPQISKSGHCFCRDFAHAPCLHLPDVHVAARLSRSLQHRPRDARLVRLHVTLYQQHQSGTLHEMYVPCVQVFACLLEA